MVGLAHGFAGLLLRLLMLIHPCTLAPKPYEEWGAASAPGAATASLKSLLLLPPLQIEQQLKLSRFVAGLHGPVAARREAAETVGLIIESLPGLTLQEDRLTALTEAGQVGDETFCLRSKARILGCFGWL